MSNFNAFRRLWPVIVAAVTVFATGAPAAKHELRIGRYQTVRTELQAEQPATDAKPASMATPDAPASCVDTVLESDAGPGKGSAPEDAVQSAVDQDVNAREGRSDAE